MKKLLIIFVAVVVVGGYLYINRDTYNYGNKFQPTFSPTLEPIQTETTQPQNTSADGNVKTFTIIGKNYSFSIPEISVSRGDTVKIIFKNSEGMHDWTLDEFNVRTPRIQKDQSAEVQFVADKSGQFQYYCSVGNHRAQGMWGTLTVK